LAFRQDTDILLARGKKISLGCQPSWVKGNSGAWESPRVTIFGDFFPIGLLLEAHYNLKKYLVAHRIDNVLGNFLLEQI
jgi:hypothetical protein